MTSVPEPPTGLHWWTFDVESHPGLTCSVRGPVVPTQPAPPAMWALVKGTAFGDIFVLVRRVRVAHRKAAARLQVRWTPDGELFDVHHARSFEEARAALAWWPFVREKLSGGRGHPPGGDAVTFAGYMKVWRELRPLYKKKGLAKGLAARLGVTERTVHNWHKDYGWPLYEDPSYFEPSD
jgi:hypothetical protein